MNIALKRIMLKRFVAITTALFAMTFMLSPLTTFAKAESYAWINNAEVKVSGSDAISSSNHFVATDWTLSTSSAKGKKAFLSKKLNAFGPLEYVRRNGYCNMYLALEFLNKDGTLANIVRAKSLAEKVSDPEECALSGDSYEFSRIGIDIGKTTNIPIDRPSTLGTGSTLLDQLGTAATNGVTIPQGCPGGPAGTKAPGTVCPTTFDTSKTVSCGFLPQSLCDTVSNGLPTTDNPLGGIGNLIDYIINIVTGLFVIAVILIIVVSGVQISASAGNPDVIKNAKSHIFNAVLGIALLISARALFSIFGIYDTGFAPPVTLFSKISRSNLSLNDFQQVLLNGIAIATFLAGIVSIIFLIVGGIQYIISSGNSERLKGAKNTVLYALVGLVVSIMAYGIVTFVVDSLT